MEHLFVRKPLYTLRTWRPEDVPALAAALDNRKIWDNCRDLLPHPYTEADASAFVALAAGREEPLEFCIEVDGAAAGNIGFRPGEDIERYSAETGYWLDERFWNRGIMSDALKEAAARYFARTSVVRLFATVFETNRPSMRVLEKAGFVRVGVQRRAVFKNGRFLDSHLYELLRP